jgi:hypothetical protein
VTDPQDDQHTHGGGMCPTCVRYGARVAAQEASKVWEAKIPAMLDEARAEAVENYAAGQAVLRQMSEAWHREQGRAEVVRDVRVALSATHGSLGDALDVLDRYSAAAGAHE